MIIESLAEKSTALSRSTLVRTIRVESRPVLVGLIRVRPSDGLRRVESANDAVWRCSGERWRIDSESAAIILSVGTESGCGVGTATVSCAAEKSLTVVSGAVVSALTVVSGIAKRVSETAVSG